MVCGFCFEPIVCGELIARWATEPLHRECGLRLQLGSVGHITRRCPCFGGGEDDPPHMTKREAARAAVTLWALMQRKN